MTEPLEIPPDEFCLKVVIPMPPSVNHYWEAIVRYAAGRRPVATVILGAEAREYRKKAGLLLRSQRPAEPLEGALLIRGEVFMERRGSDLDNRLKGSLDALSHSGIWQDDNQVCGIDIRRKLDPNHPRIVLEIWRTFDPELMEAWNLVGYKSLWHKVKGVLKMRAA